MEATVSLNPLVSWLQSEILSTGAEVVVLCGNHAFRWYSDLRALVRPQIILIHPNALNYVPIEGRTVLLLADETEIGRQLYEVFTHVRDGKPASVRISSAFLDACPTATKGRETSMQFLSQHRPNDKSFVDALRRARVWRSFDSCDDFHRQAIIRPRKEMRWTSRAPFNADATLLRLSGVNGAQKPRESGDLVLSGSQGG